MRGLWASAALALWLPGTALAFLAPTAIPGRDRPAPSGPPPFLTSLASLRPRRPALLPAGGSAEFAHKRGGDAHLAAATTTGAAAGRDIADVTTQLERSVASSIGSGALGPLDLVEELSALKLNAGVARRPWTDAFRALVSDPVFIECWGKQPFRLATEMPFAVNCFTIHDLDEFARFYPLVFAGAGTVLENGGWMMARLDQQLDRAAEPMRASDVSDSLSRGTVSLNSAGFFMAPLASICGAVLEAFQLPIWLNVYITEAGRQSSAPCHTDKQDVLAVQSTGRKRWRVFAPPSPASKIAADPWARGKGQDILSVEDELGPALLDVTLSPGQLLYIPAGFPHVTDTIVDAEGEPSVHLTLGVDTHVWDLNYASMRHSALKRQKLSTLIDGSFSTNKLELPAWQALHTPLPLGFAAAPLLEGAVSKPQASEPLAGGKSVQRSLAGLSTAQQILTQKIASECARRMLEAEPERWQRSDEAGLIEELQLHVVAARYLEHYQRVMATQRKVYADASLQVREIGDQVSMRAKPFLDELESHMASLAAWSDGLDEPSPPCAAAPLAQQSAGKAVAGKGGMGNKGGMGGLGMTKKKKKKK